MPSSTIDRRSSGSMTASSERMAALAQFALDADAGFADLALEALASGDAAALEPFELLLCLARRGHRLDGVAHARDDAVAGDQRGADGDQHGALGVVADDLR